MSQLESKFRGYYERLRHKAAVQAMGSLMLSQPDWNKTAIAIQAIEQADALMKELQLTEAVEEIPD